MPLRDPLRRDFLVTLGALSLSARLRAQSEAERLVAAIQDGGKIIYLTPVGNTQAQRLGAALSALRVPMNEILVSPLVEARDTAEQAFGADRVTATMDLTERLVRTPPSPGNNRILVGHRTALEMVTRRQFPDSVLPGGATAIFLPGGEIDLLGTLTAERLIQSAERRGALR